MSEADWALVTAVVDRLVPAGDSPSAGQVGLVGRLATDAAGLHHRLWSTLLAAGPLALGEEARARGLDPFGELGAQDQDAVLRDVEAGRTRETWPVPAPEFHRQLVRLVAEGCCGDRGAPSWQVVGHDPALERPSRSDGTWRPAPATRRPRPPRCPRAGAPPHGGDDHLPAGHRADREDTTTRTAPAPVFLGDGRIAFADHDYPDKRADTGFTADGGYGPYELVSETAFFAVPDAVAAADAVLLLDVMGTSSHALGRIRRVREDVESLYVAGAGPIGLGVLVMAGLRWGADLPVHISDVSAWRLDLAEQLGGIPVDASDAGAVAALGPVDAAVDSTGRTAARTAALAALGRRGVLACVGHGEGLTLSVSSDLIAPERTVMGSEYFRYDEMAGNLELLLAHRDRVAALVTHRFDVAQVQEAFEAFLGGRTGKVVVTQDAAR